MSTPELTVVANRLPVRRKGDGWITSPGGLVTALKPVLENGGAWVGWSGDTEHYEPFVQDGIRITPVPIDAQLAVAVVAPATDGAGDVPRAAVIVAAHDLGRGHAAEIDGDRAGAIGGRAVAQLT